MGSVNTAYGRIESYVEHVSSNWAGNYSRIRLIIRMVNNGTARAYNRNAIGLSVWGSGGNWNGSFTFDIPGGGNWQNIAVLEWDIGHAADGTLAVNFGMDLGNTGTTTFGDPPPFEHGVVGISRIPKRPNPPGKPSISNNTTGTSVTVSWTASNNNQGSAITSYLLRRWTGSSASGSYVDSSANNLSRSMTGLAKGTTYTVGVYAKNGAADNNGYSNVSGLTTFTTPKEPSAPATPSHTFTAPGTIKFSWSAPANNGAGITGYDIQYADNSSFSNATTVATTSTSYTFTVPATGYGKTWYFRVRAKNSVGTGSFSGAGSRAVPNEPSTPGTPTLVYTAPTTVKISWSEPANNGASITGYTVQYADNSSFTSAKTVTATSTSVTVSDVTVGKTWYFRVLATNSQGSSSYSSAADVLVVCGPRVRIGGVWKNTIAYVRIGGVWKVATPYVRTGGAWKIAGG